MDDADAALQRHSYRQRRLRNLPPEYKSTIRDSNESGWSQRNLWHQSTFQDLQFGRWWCAAAVQLTVSIGEETKGHLRRMLRVILVLVDTS